MLGLLLGSAAVGTGTHWALSRLFPSGNQRLEEESRRADIKLGKEQRKARALLAAQQEDYERSMGARSGGSLSEEAIALLMSQVLGDVEGRAVMGGQRVSTPNEPDLAGLEALARLAKESRQASPNMRTARLYGVR